MVGPFGYAGLSLARPLGVVRPAYDDVLVGILVASGLTYTLKVENSCRSRGAGMHRRCIRRADTQRRCLKGGQVFWPQIVQ
jgi:hypothetical protein